MNTTKKTAEAGPGTATGDNTIGSTSTTANNKDKIQVPVATKNNKVLVTTASGPAFIPKPEPVPNPPPSDSVDAGLGPKPEPVPSPPPTSLPFKLIWATIMAPSNPSV